MIEREHLDHYLILLNGDVSDNRVFTFASVLAFFDGLFMVYQWIPLCFLDVCYIEFILAIK